MQHLYKILFLGLLVISISSCDSEDGCLDHLATNFDVTADVDCSGDDVSCQCIYPNWRFTSAFVYGDKSHHKDSVRVNDLGQSFKIVKGGFFLSNMTLKDITSVSTQSIELADVKLNNDENISYKDDITAIHTSVSTFFNTPFRHESLTTDSLTIELGLPSSFSSIDVSRLSSSSVFNVDDKYMIDTLTQNILNHKISIHRVLQDDTIHIVSDILDTPLLKFSKLTAKDISFNEDIVSTLLIDFKIILDQLNLEDNNNQWSSIINNNWSNALTIQ